ncbi:MAG: hypothetical protein SGJ11_03250 [Phycisphaerae bacterium]|mgnify:CR=1 FL=1|nr:hypothetical protein [Phycisphaerae bacterium]
MTRASHLFVASSLLAVIPTAALAEVLTFSGAGDSAAIAPALADFRAALGQLNANNPVCFGSGRREINWDAVPDTLSSPNEFPGDFFNFTTPGRARGAAFSTDARAHFQTSAKEVSPDGALVEFGNVDPNYVEQFSAFTPQRLFAPIGSTTTIGDFFVAGTVTLTAGITGFGAVFTDVDVEGSTTITALAADGTVLGTVAAPATTGDGQFSFASIAVQGLPRIAKIHIISGNLPLAPGNIDDAANGDDTVAMDDFIYGEPVNLECESDLNGDGQVGAADLAILLGAWGPVGASPSDFNGDGEVAAWDLAWLLGKWGPC